MVEYYLPKVGVEGSSPFYRSRVYNYGEIKDITDDKCFG